MSLATLLAPSVLAHGLGRHGYALLFAASVVEGPLVTVLAAYLSAQGLLDPGAVYATVVLGDLAGDALYYVAGRWLLRGLGPRARPDGALRRRIEAWRDYLRERPGRVLLMGKLTHSAGFAVLLGAGAARVPPARYMAYNLLGALPKSAVLVLLGYFWGRFLGELQSDLRLAGVCGLLLALLAVAGVARRLPLARAAGAGAAGHAGRAGDPAE